MIKLTILSLAAFSLCGQTNPSLLVDTEWLGNHLTDRDLILLHVGTPAGYDKAHIAGARLLILDGITVPVTHAAKELSVELPASEILRAKFASLGVSDTSRIVVYPGVESQITSATRTIFTLDYIGLGARTSFLNGGMAAWTKAGKPVTTDIPRVTAGSLTAKPEKKLLADVEFVKSVPELTGYKLVDARLPNFYQGADATYEKNGHLPGAVNVPFQDLTDDKLTLNPERISKAFALAGIHPGDTLVVYCHIGMQATTVILAARTMGNPVLLYDGSFQDWAINNRGPVVK